MKTISLLLAIASLASLTGCGTTAASLQKRTDAQLSRTVYATDDSIKAKRYDLAKTYSAQTTQLVAPPADSDRIKIKGFTKKISQPVQVNNISSDAKPSATPKKKPAKKRPANSSTFDENSVNFKETPVATPTATPEPQTVTVEVPVVVLPPEDQGAAVVVVDTPEYKAMEAKYQAQLAQEAKDKASNQARIVKLVQDKQAFAEEQLREQQNDTWWKSIKRFFGWSSVFGLVGLAGIVALCIFNPALGLGVVTLVVNILTTIGSVLAFVFTAILTVINGLFAKKPAPTPAPTPVPAPVPPAPAPTPPKV